MNIRKLLSLALALALLLALGAPVLAADAEEPPYPDVDVSWRWAWSVINTATQRGLFRGYEDGRFAPGDYVTEATGLTLAARMMTAPDTRTAILADRLEQMRTIIPGTAADPDDAAAPYVWFRKEAAVCLELEVLAEAQLRTLYSRNRLGEPMSKADFAVYLVRAMGLQEVAESLDAAVLPFVDEASISAIYRPYIKLLNVYGVVEGDENGCFNPDDPMTRAVCATMLVKTLTNVVERRGVSIELPGYDPAYDFILGTVREVEAGEDNSRQVTLENDFTGERTVDVPASARLYQNNMAADPAALRVGVLAKLCLDADGAVASVRLTPADRLTSLSGVCNAVTAQTVTVDGVTYPLDRFTQVQAGDRTGDAAVIDPEAGYTDARLTLDSRGGVVYLKLSGGTREVTGILADLSAADGRTAITVNSLSGVPTTYEVPDAAAVTVNGAAASLQDSHVGAWVTLRVDDDDLSSLDSVEVDPLSRYVQGILKSADADSQPRRVEITPTGETVSAAYDLAAACAFWNEGETATDDDFARLAAGSFVTARVEGGVITRLHIYRGYEEVKGTLTAMEYDDFTTLVVTRSDGTVTRLSIPNADLKNVTFTENGREADVTKLHAGDQVVVTLYCRAVTGVDIVPQEADTSGTVTSVTTHEDGSVEFTLRFADSTTAVYSAAAATAVTREGSAASLSDLRPGLRVSLVTSGLRVLSIQIIGTESRQESLEGVIHQREEGSREIILRVGNGTDARLVKVYIPSTATILDVRTGVATSRLSGLAVHDVLEVYGAYNSDGVFEAVSVIKK